MDGEEAPLLQVNVLLAGVQLSAGNHVVEFTYETPGLRMGAMMTLAGLILLVVLVVCERRFGWHLPGSCHIPSASLCSREARLYSFRPKNAEPRP